jgi:hypothetical protein
MKIIKFLASVLTTAFAISAGVANAVAPTVSITSPANNANFVAPASITITAKATDNSGAVTTSAAITLKVNANVAPTASITSPAANASFAAPATITINANAADTDGTISKVEFFNGTTLLGSDTTSPYSYTWSNVAIGTYSLTAKATDDKGATKTSTAVSVTVATNKVPTVSITAPASNASFTAPGSIAISANAADTDGTIAKVDFYNGTTLLGTDTTAPYAYTWAGVAAGTYSITAKATDDKGAVATSSAVSVTVSANQAPTVSITSPAANASFAAPASITINANAADANGTISKVEFYSGTTLLGSDTTSPYSFTWSNVAAGTYSLTAKATDNAGAATTSAAVSISVVSNQAPTVSVTAPANNATFTAPAGINITANAADANGTITKVEFFNGTTLLGTDTTSPYSYSWANVAAGTYAITAKATDNGGASTTSAVVNITVGAAQTLSVNITTPPNNTVIPTGSSIDVNADVTGNIAKAELFEGAVLQETLIGAPYQFSWSSAAPGTYALTVKVTDNAGAVATSAVRTITVVQNQPPLVDFNEPVINASAPIYEGDITLGAIASDPDGSISYVQFFRINNSSQEIEIGTAYQPPYRYIWTGVQLGNYNLLAKVTDNSFATTVSAIRPLSVKANPGLISVSFKMQGSAFIDKAVYSTTRRLFPSISFFAGVKPQRAQIYANTTLLCETVNDYDLTIGKLACEGATLAAGTYAISAKFTTASGTIVSNTAGSIYVEAAPSISAVFTKPVEGVKFWPGHLDFEGNVVLPAGATLKLYRGCDTLLASNEIPVVVSGTRFTATLDWTPNPFNAPATQECFRAFAIAPDGRSAQAAKDVQFFVPSVAFVNKPVTAYTPTVDLEVSATIPPGTPRVEINGVVATLTGNTYKSNLPLTVGSNNITAIAYNGATEIARTSFYISYVASLARTLTANITRPQYTSVPAAHVNFVTALTTANVYGTVTGVPATTVLIRDAEGSTRIAKILSDGTYNESITAYSGYNEVIVTAYGPGGALATATTGFMNFTADDTPAIVITSPAACSVVSTAPTTINMLASAYRPDGLNVFSGSYTTTFNANNIQVGSANMGAGNIENNITATWNDPLNGSYLLTALSNVGSGTVSSKPVRVTVNLANATQTCALVSPQNNASYAAGSAIPLEATATDASGTISKVEFFDGASLLASVTAPPYRYSWTTASQGSHTISVKATNDRGATAVCAPAAQIQVSPNFIPTVRLSTPPPGTVFLEGGGAIIVPTVSTNVVKVQLWRGTTMLKEETVAPFKFTLTTLAAGSYTLFARAFDNQGATSADSNSITFQVSISPTVSLNAPASGSIYSAPATIPISVSASVPDGTIQRVEISSNGSVIATLTTAPYTFNWTNVPAGSYAIAANAFSSWGASPEAILQPKRDVVVYAPTQVGTVNAPNVTLTAPANNSTVGTPVTLTVNAQNIAGTIATIEFLDGANQIIGYNINAASSNYTLNYVWTNPTSGSHTITAKVKNSAGVVFTSAPITVQISAAPTSNLSAAGSFYLAPANVDLVIGTTVSAVGATLSRVEIYSSVVTGGSSGTPTLVTTLSAPPYRYRLSNLAVGTYKIIARAVDSLGNTSDSAPLEIRVGTAYGIVLPATLNGSTINGNTLSFVATINALANSSVTVNGVNTTVSRDGRIVVNGLALTAGVNTITITVTPPSGPVLTQTFTVTRATTPPSLEMTVSPAQGAAPLLSLVEVKNPGNTPFATELLSCDNPTGNVALAENQSTTLAGALECRYTKPGVYQPWAAIKDASGAVIWTSTKYVVVSGPLDSYQIVRNVYSNMLDQLKAGNKAGALTNFFGHAQTKYGAIFTALGTDLATFAAQLGTIGTVTISGGSAEIVLVRDVNSVKQTFTIYLLLGEDGVWRIESM